MGLAGSSRARYLFGGGGRLEDSWGGGSFSEAGRPGREGIY